MASEPYGVVEVTDRYIRMDGETPGEPGQPHRESGPDHQPRWHAGRLDIDGITSVSPTTAPSCRSPTPIVDHRRDHHPRHRPRLVPALPAQGDLRGAGVVPQDAARQAARDDDGRLRVEAEQRQRSPSDPPSAPRRRDPAGRWSSARAPPPSPARAWAHLLAARCRRGPRRGGPPCHRAVGLRDARRHERHARRRHQPVGHDDRHQPHRRPRPWHAAPHVMAIVNRRGSDLTDKSDGVLYTSDGRDVEMSVASTKAFYSPDRCRLRCWPSPSPTRPAVPAPKCRTTVPEHPSHPSTTSPRPWNATIGQRAEVIGRRRPRVRPASRRYWAIVGNGPNVRRRSRDAGSSSPSSVTSRSPADSTEDKKHIDLSSEPMILICAAGLVGLHRRPTCPRRWRSTAPTRLRRS